MTFSEICMLEGGKDEFLIRTACWGKAGSWKIFSWLAHAWVRGDVNNVPSI